MWCGYKINGLNFFRFPVNLATAWGVWYWHVLSPPFAVTISRSCGKQFGSTLCLKWIVFLFAVGIMLSVNVKQRVNVKFYVRIGKSATETYDLLKKVYGEDCLSRTHVFEWFKRFKEGRNVISAPVVPAHQKQTLTSKKSVKLFDRIVALSFKQLLS
jgi:hypothetical protein